MSRTTGVARKKPNSHPNYMRNQIEEREGARGTSSRSRLKVRRVGLVITAGFAVSLASVGVAAASPGTYYATPYQNNNNRTCPYTSCGIRSVLQANVAYLANCWTYGQTISDNGYVNDIWIQIRYTDGSIGYSSAVYMKGDERANLPQWASC
jgi:hypothetical protein